MSKAPIPMSNGIYTLIFLRLFLCEEERRGFKRGEKEEKRRERRDGDEREVKRETGE